MKSEVNTARQLSNNFPAGLTVSMHHEMESDVLRFKYGTCVATVGIGSTTTKQGKDKLWATVYKIEADYDQKEDIKLLLSSLRDHYKKHGYDFAFSFADNAKLKGILYKLGIKEREQPTGTFDPSSEK